jgi:hypothetical protein
MSTQAKAAAPQLPPVVKSLVVARSIEEAFRLYTQDIGKWWPSATHSLGGEKVAAVAIEGRVGGRIYERWRDGTEMTWGTIREWDAPKRIVHTWHVSTDPDHASEVELRFVALAPERTRVTLEHRHWERMAGEKAQEVRGGYDQGWQAILMDLFGKIAGKVNEP